MIRRLVWLMALALVVGACTDDPGVTPTTGLTETSGDTTTTTTGPGLDGLPEHLREEIETLIGVTEDLRGLLFLTTPAVITVTPEEMEERIRGLIADDAEHVPADEALYKLLGLFPETGNLDSLLLDLYGEQAAGFYDGETGELVVTASDEGLSVTQRATLVHELTHALADQHFGFHDIFTAMFDEDRLDEAAAYQAVIEGDATFLQLQYVRGLGLQELSEFVAEAFEIDTAVLDSAPGFLRDSLLFPYDDGTALVQDAFSKGGWDSVNQLYTAPPRSTEQVISPDAIGVDDPLTVELPEIDVPDYELSITSTWGQLGLRLMLDQALGTEESDTASRGWGGDIYHQWFDGAEAAFVLFYRGDTATDAIELGDALVLYVAEAMAVGAPTTANGSTVFSGDDYAYVAVEGRNVHFVAADIPAVGRLIVEELP